MTKKDIIKNLTDLGVWSDSMVPAVDSLVNINNRLDAMWKIVVKAKYVIEFTSREGDKRANEHPLLKEINKLEATKVKFMDSLLLTPASLKRLGVTSKIAESAFDDLKK